MASSAEVDAWKALGGSVEEKTSGNRKMKTYVAPDGKKLKTWKEAAEILKAAEAEEKHGRKRAQASPDVAADDKENKKKRQKQQTAPAAAAAADTDKPAADKPAADKPKPTPKSGKKAAAGGKRKSAQQPTPEPKKEEAEEAKAPAAADAAEDDKADDATPMEEDGAASEQEQDGDDASEGEEEEDAAAEKVPARASGSGRRAAQGVKSYKEAKAKERMSKKDRVEEKHEPKVESETEAVAQTAGETSGNMRRLLNFSVVDEAGELQHLDRLELLKKHIKLTGAVYPGQGPLSSKESGRQLQQPFGPISSWHVRYSSSSSSAGPVLVAVTAKASYVLVKPSQAYRKVFGILEEQAGLAWHVMQAIDPELGGSASASLDAVVAKLARAKAGKGYASAREALLLNGRFVLAQVAAHEARRAGGAKAAADKGKGKAPAGLSSGPFYSELEAELAKGPIQVGLVSGNSIKIRDMQAEAAAAGSAAAVGGEPDALTAADEDMARRLQAKMDAQSMGVGKGRGSAAGGRGGPAYIKISEAEIADDYPMPKQYKAPDGVEETDELLLWDEEMADVDPECLPKRLITDFSIYNGEGFFASLELLPLWAGVDPDVELYASGIVKDDEGNWGTGGQPLEIAQAKQQPEQQQKKDKKKSKQEQGEEKAAAAAGGSSAAGGLSAAAAGGGSGAGGSSSSGAGGSSKAGGSSAAAAGSSGAGGSGSAATAGDSGSAAAAAAAEEPAAAADASKEVAMEAGPDPVAEGGMRLYLSQIREWVVEFSADMLFISIRTDAAWYKLCRPNPEYAPWYGVPLKSARVAVAVINMLQQESRASRLSFADIVKRLAEVPPGSHTFISKRPDRVERYLVVHGQILLNQIKAYPSAAVQKAPFVGALREKMEARKHSKLFYSKRGFSKAVRVVNRNPMKDRASSGRAKPMPATATTMVRAIWLNYFSALEEAGKKDAAAAAAAAEAAAKDGAEGEVAKEVEDDPLEEEEQEEAGDDQEDALAGGKGPGSPKKKRASRSSKGSKGKGKEAAAAAAGSAGSSQQAEAAAGGAAEQQKEKEKKAAPLKVTWKDAGAKPDNEGRVMHKKAQVGSWQLQLGSVVLLEAEAEDEDAQAQQYLFGLVQCMWEDEDGEALAQVRMLAAGRDTVLGDAAAEEQLFLTGDYEDIALADISGLGNVKPLRREFDPELRVRQFQEDEAMRARNAAAKAEGRPLEHFYRHLYLPEQGMFRALPVEKDLGLGVYQEGPAAPIELGMLPADKGKGFIKNGVDYRVGDFLYVHTDTFDVEESSEEEQESEEEDKDKDNKASLPAYASKKGRFHKGSCAGLRAWGLARLMEVKEAGSSSRNKDKDKAALPSKLRLQRFFRPEDVGKEEAYQAGFWDVYATPEPASASSSEGWVHWVDVDSVIRKCCVKAQGAATPEGCKDLDCFEVVGTYNPASKELSAAPKEFSAASQDMQLDGAAAAAEDDNSLAMATMDIFAGCGGLSEGMHQAGVADTKWAIEYEQPAADAFKLNNPEAAVFCNNCNVILVAAMQKAGLDSDCSACDDAKTAAASMSPEDVAALPQPGQVEFIMGGPPCQGYSGMNRFNKGNWSMVQNSMVMAFLSFADFYRPRYFLLENVRNFVSHNKSFTFRLTLRTLLDMGYQVRFGVLNAGNFGVPQSRKRTFIWAAAPDEGLPEWPKPRTVFRSPQLTVNLPGGVAYCAVDTSIPGAPLRTVTVRDAIGDLPTIQNGHDKDVMPYSGPAVSAFQKLMRSKADVLRDHICKEMNDLNLERCTCIPKDSPGADWRVLLEIVKNDPGREKFNGQPLVPWCLPNTAERHNGWRGLFGRLDLAGHFPTSTTDPQPMGKVGQVFHPNQDRIVSVRECARSQGFPDHFFFSGNVHSRHRQVGNAVPPPLAASLGRQLRKALAATQEKRAAELMTW